MKIKKRNEFIEQKPRSKKRKLNYGTQLAHNDEYLRRTGLEIRSARNQSYIKDSKV